MNHEKSFTIQAGFFCWSAIRDLLERHKFLGHNIEYLEGTGVLTRPFTIKGDTFDVDQVYSEIKTMEARLEATK